MMVSRVVRLWAGAVFAIGLAGACAHPTSPATGVNPIRAADDAAKRAIAAERTINVAAIPSRTVSVAPLAVAATDTALAPLSYGLADLLMTDLSRSSRLTIVERLQMGAILRELKLGQSGLVDTTTAPRVGRLLGSRRIVVGSLSQRPGEQFGIDARIADVATSQIRPAVSARAPIADVLAAEKALAFRLFDELGVVLTPAERALVDERPTRNIAALLAYSRGVQRDVEGRYAEALREYDRAVQLDSGFTMAKQRSRESRAHLAALTGGGPGTPSGPSFPGDEITSPASPRRIGKILIDNINVLRYSPLGGSGRPGTVGDPAFPVSTVVIIVTITTPP
jgi:TolB-like protein